MKNDFSFSKFEQLRRKAEELLKDNNAGEENLSQMDVLSLIHELEVHQVELQLQNEELRQARQEVDESRRAYEELYDYAPTGYVSLNPKGVVVSANRMALELLGLSKQQLMGFGFSLFIHTEDHAAYYSLIRSVADENGGISSEEIRLIRNEHVHFYARVEVSASRDVAGRFNGWRLVFSDISERKRMETELRRTRDELELRVQERTAELGAANAGLTEYSAKLEKLNNELQEFAFVASHDLQEPLRKIQSFGNRLSCKYRDSLGEESKDYLGRMIAAANRMSDLLQALLAYSRIATRPNPFKPTGLGEVVADALSDLEVSLEESGASVEVGDLPVVEGDAPQLRQLFQNLIGNSIKYRLESEKLLIRIYGRVDGGTCDIFVQDNGIGFDERHLDRIFKPFQRLHGRSAAYQGTGMGLAICRKVVERHGGSITARSKPGEGSVFIITLPVKQPQPA